MKLEIVYKSGISSEFVPCPSCGIIVSRYNGLEDVGGDIRKCKHCLSVLRVIE